MLPHTPLSQIFIRLDRLDANLKLWRQLIGPHVKLAAAVKSNAYGLGAPDIASHLETAGVDLLIVYNTTQAIELLDAHITTPIAILLPDLNLNPNLNANSNTDSPFDDPALLDALARGQIHLGIDAPHQLDSVVMLARRVAKSHTHTPIPIHLHLDTGMSRAGMTPQQFADTLPHAASLRPSGILLAGIYTHMACTDHPTISAQHHQFDNILQQHHHQQPPDLIIHTSATHATLRDVDFHRDMVRIGIGLYGYGSAPLTGTTPHPPLLKHASDFQHVLRWQSQITHITPRPAGTPVGYNPQHTLKHNARIGIVPVGYGDGYPLALSNQSHVKIGTHHAPILGRVNMDQIIIDLSQFPTVHLGHPVDIISDDPNSPCSLPNLAKLAGTHCYEILCRIRKSIPRQYIHSTPPHPPIHITTIPK